MRDGLLPWLRADGKAEVTVEYPRPGEHSPDIALAEVRRLLLEHIVEPTLAGTARKADLRVLLNPAGSFVLGGPAADCGVTGRKIIVDSYGGAARHGGGAFSGKDTTKVDRSAAYMARQLALRVVRAGLAARCELQVAYPIGVSQPVSLFVDTFGTGVVADDVIAAALTRTANLTPRGIATTLDLWRPRYRETARAGHFGHPPESGGNAFTWERTSEADLAALRPEVRC